MIKINKLSNQLGISPALFWGFVGVIFFALGTGIEVNWFSMYLEQLNYPVGYISFVFSFYGFAIFLGSYLTSFIVDRYGSYLVMLSGVGLSILSGVLIVASLRVELPTFLAFSYLLRGLSYPLFINGFLVVITIRTQIHHLGKATGLFFLASNLGISIIGPVLSARLLEKVGVDTLFYLGMMLCVLAYVLSLQLTKTAHTKGDKNKPIFSGVKSGLTILFSDRRLLIAVVVLIINNMGRFGFIIVMPIFLLTRGFTLNQWASIWAITYSVNAVAGLVFGYLGDKFGHRQIAMWFSGTITALSCLMIWVSTSYFAGNVILLGLSFSVFAIGIAAYGLISALVPAILEKNKSVSVSILNLGSGLSGFVGSFVSGLLFNWFGANVMLLVFVGVYLASSGLIYFIKTDNPSCPPDTNQL